MAEQKPIEIDLMNLRTLGKFDPELVDLYDEKGRKKKTPTKKQVKTTQLDKRELNEINSTNNESNKTNETNIINLESDLDKYNAKLVDLYDEENREKLSPNEITNGITPDKLKNRDLKAEINLKNIDTSDRRTEAEKERTEEENQSTIDNINNYNAKLVDLYDEKGRNKKTPNEITNGITSDELKNRDLKAEINLDDINTSDRRIEVEKKRTEEKKQSTIDDIDKYNVKFVDQYDENKGKKSPEQQGQVSFDLMKNRENNPNTLISNKTPEYKQNILYKKDADPSGGIDAVGANIASAFPGQDNRVFNTKGGYTVTQETVTFDDIEQRKRNLSSEMNIFLYNLFPYFGTGIVKDVMNAQAPTDPLKAMNLLGGLLNNLTTLKYIDAIELSLLLVSNFYTMSFIKGIKIKKKAASVFSIELSPGTDVRFGDKYNASIIDYVVDAIKSLIPPSVKPTENPNIEGASLKVEKTAQIIISDNSAITAKLDPNKSIFDPTNTFNVTETLNTILYPVNSADLEVERQTTAQKEFKYLKEAVRKKSYFKSPNGENIYQIGSIFVMPMFDPDNKDGSKNFYIPFEFNPQIDEGSVTTKYQANEFLARIGQTQSFSGVDSMTANITTKYWAVSDGKDPPAEAAWMKNFTMENVQAIEAMYRSLSLPSYPKVENEVDNGYKYVKPPLIKVVMGQVAARASLYQGLLTYGIANIEDKRKSEEERKGFRTFVVTSVSIKKDLIETPLYLDRYFSIVDTFGFEVSLSLVEVTKSYTDQQPDFQSYYKRYIKVYKEYSK